MQESLYNRLASEDLKHITVSWALQALGDLALEHGIKRLSGSTNTEEAAAEETEAVSTPAQNPQLHDHLLNVMLGVLDRWRDSLEAPEKKSKRAKADPPGAVKCEATEIGVLCIFQLQELQWFLSTSA